MICRSYGAYRNLNTGNYKDFAPTEHVIVRAVLLGDAYRGLKPRLRKAYVAAVFDGLNWL